jgi:cytochrome P450
MGEAIEEVLRYDAPVQHVVRTTTADADLSVGRIPRGARVLLIYGSANRDERVWRHPDRLMLRREPQRHVAFGEGVHHCIGAPLARLEASVALTEFLRRWPAYEIGRPVRLPNFIVRGFESLPGVLNP